MNLYVPSKEEFKSLIENTLRPLLEKELPKILRDLSQKKWVSPKELNDIVGISLRKQQYLRDKKRIPYHKDGRKIIYNMDEIEEYLRKNKIEPRR